MALIRNLLAAGACVLACSGAVAQDITGAGATFPAPIYAKWAEAYKGATGAQLNYQAIGSGGGIKQITAKTVDFGASDDPMSGDDLTKNGLTQFPAVIGGVVVAFNVPGIAANQITLDGAVTADIFRGAIKSWDDPAIAKLNPGLKLPATAITVVYRSDSSGTTAVFTDYLVGVSAPFKASPGEGKTVNWPVGIGGRGNAGVAANVTKIAGAIGYVEFAFAKQNKIAYAQQINRDGKPVQADDTTFAAAAEKADWNAAPGFGISLTNQAGASSWPITAASFILMHKNAADPKRSAEVLKFFKWAYANGAKAAVEMDYVPIPATVTKQIESSWKEIKDASGKAVLN